MESGGFRVEEKMDDRHICDFLATSLFSTAVFAKEDHGKGSLVALGDSITFGYNLGVNNNHVSKYVRQNDIHPTVLGQKQLAKAGLKALSVFDKE